MRTYQISHEKIVQVRTLLDEVGRSLGAADLTGADLDIISRKIDEVTTIAESLSTAARLIGESRYYI